MKTEKPKRISWDFLKNEYVLPKCPFDFHTEPTDYFTWQGLNANEELINWQEKRIGELEDWLSDQSPVRRRSRLDVREIYKLESLLKNAIEVIMINRQYLRSRELLENQKEVDWDAFESSCIFTKEFLEENKEALEKLK